MNGQSLHVTVSVRVQFGPGVALADEGITLHRLAVGRNPNHLTQPRFQRLGLGPGHEIGTFASTEKKISLTVKKYPSAVVQIAFVVGRGAVYDGCPFDFGFVGREFPLSYRREITLVRRLRKSPVHHTVAFELWVQGNAQQASLAFLIHSGQTGNRLAQLAVLGHNAQITCFLRQDQPSVGHTGDSPGRLQSLGQYLTLVRGGSFDPGYPGLIGESGLVFR